ncbi:NADH-quinone oxidoreductase subunit A [Carboxydochorda subterranea]|uniref:NADH-quinone oxidoreductase subunit n=1 Tax=Carboxydichorda subterranea TaxID=3109565 RepID=A0ABZ1BZD8_9FIRM|nr:NADH-quinone oxidoreductase subunit A [Limnochorda sp. L945t]WRP18189.1 NADH-quinone oxidoreductase subunit A [Limnochorda sp. L945t]
MEAYGALSIYLAVVLVVTATISLLAARVGPRRPDPVKAEAYESGYPTPPLLGRFSVKFYVVAMLFVIFDVETVAFYPWAIQVRHLGGYGLAVMGLFLLILAIGDAYVWRKGGFEWK